MDTFSALTRAPQPPPFDSVDVLRELEALLPQWPSDLQRSFLQIARYLTGIAAAPVSVLSLAGSTPAVSGASPPIAVPRHRAAAADRQCQRPCPVDTASA
jgi:hypothetical protein